MPVATRLQAYFRAVVAARRVAIPAAPFTLFCRPPGAAAECVAIPDAPVGGDVGDTLVALRAAGPASAGQLRLDFVEAFAPALVPVLRAAGFVETGREEILACTPATFRPAAAVPGLAFTVTTAETPLPAVRAALDAHARLWDPGTAEATTAAEAAAFRDALGAGRGVSVWLDGRIVGDGLLELPRGGVAELVGIVTAAAYRRRGVGAAVTARLVGEAFALGVDLPFLIAADPAARRVYERVGFRSRAVRLRYRPPPAP